VDWRLGECGDKFIGVCTLIMGAESADFFFYCWYSEVLAYDRVWHVPGGIHYQTQDFRLKTFQYCDVGILGRTPELNAIRPDGFEYCFVDEEFVADREFGLTSK
jgi:hypothetical protein